MMHVIIGISIIVVALLLILFFVGRFIPKHFLKLQVLSNTKEGLLSPDFSCYLAEKENANYIENYTLVLDEKKDKRFIKVKYQPDVHNLSFYVVLFDNRHKPLGIKRVTINNAQALKSQLIPVVSNVAGLFLQIVEADGEVFDQEYPCFITRRSILKASIFNGFIITIMSLLMSFGVSLVMNGAFFSSPLFGMYAFPATDTQTLFIVILAVFALTILVSFFLLRAINKKYLREDVEL
jgi:hypothetical protein